MKYTKNINGQTIIKERKNIVLRIEMDGRKMQVFNPTEEMLFEDGWEEHVPVVYEPTEEEIINREKENMIEDIIRYDSSNEVNEFYISDMPLWLDKATRAGLKLRFDAEIAMGKTDTILWYNSYQFPLSLESAIQMLYALEVYASACYDNTQAHLATIEKLTTIEEVKSYDYTTGYPEKLKF